MGLRLECTRVLHEGLFVLILMNGNKVGVCSELERDRIRVVQMNNLMDNLI